MNKQYNSILLIINNIYKIYEFIPIAVQFVFAKPISVFHILDFAGRSVP